MRQLIGLARGNTGISCAVSCFQAPFAALLFVYGPGVLTSVTNNENMQEGPLARVDVFYYREDAHTVPLIRWLDDIPAKARQKCLARLQRLEELGHELRRPEGDYLRDPEKHRFQGR